MTYLDDFARQRLLSALMLLVIALFLSSGYPAAARWRRQLRIAASGLFAIAVFIARVRIGVWLVDRGP